MNSVKDNFNRKEIDYEAEVIKSVNTEFAVYKAEMLSQNLRRFSVSIIRSM